MNDLLERYLAAVCSYFIGPKKEAVYQTLKSEIKKSAKHYDDLEDLIIQYGHPRSVALSYGYRPFMTHIYNPKIYIKIQKYMFTFAFIYLILSTLFSLYQLDYLPFIPKHEFITHAQKLFPWIFTHTTLIMIGIALVSIFLLIMLDKKYPVNQVYDLTWNQNSLAALPHPSRYPSHFIETILMFVFAMYFLGFYIYFNSSTIIHVQNTTYQMIHLLTSFFQPFVMMILFDYIVDLTKKTYTRNYLKYSIMINIFILIALIFFILNSGYLKDFLLPMNGIYHYATINFLIMGAIILISFISLYKIIRNFKYYSSLFKK